MAVAPPSRVALIDGGSFVLPYDFELARVLASQGIEIDFHGSRSSYNAPFLSSLAELPGARVFARAISRTVAPRWKGVFAYLGLWLGVLRQRRHYRVVNLQFSVLWLLELPFLLALRRCLVYTVHNAVPHGFAGRRHAPTARIARLAHALVFASRFSCDDFLARYGESFRAKSRVVPHGPAPIAPGLPATAYQPLHGVPEALVYWSTVKPYKGVELMAELAREGSLRERGVGLEVWGAWDPALNGLRAEMVAHGIRVEDRFVDGGELQSLFARRVVFVLPYLEASQSGALYSLLHHGCYFVCADVGDLGDFMRRCGLAALLLRERSVDEVMACVDRLMADPVHWARTFESAQRTTATAAETATAEVYGLSFAPAPARA